MKFSAVLLIAAFGQSTAVTAGTGFARQWLNQHGAPSGDELAELRQVNPDAYAIVKALLTKRSLGLLDPKHPTASFSAAPPQADVPSGPEVFQALMPPAKNAVYADVPSAGHQDWLSWKPQASAMDDDAMVKSVLGAVASLKAGQSGGNLRGAAPQQEAPADPLAWTQPAPAADVAAPVIAQAQPVTLPETVMSAPAQATPKASWSQENSYLKDIDFGVKTPVADAPVAGGENSYLKGLNLDNSAAPMAAPVQPHQLSPDAPSALSSFSFDDSAPTTPKPQAAAPKAAAPGNALLSWLGGASVQKKPAPAAQMIQKPRADAMSQYLSDLQ